jgi:hypothetical protein
MYTISETLMNEFKRENFFAQELVYIGLRDSSGNQSITSTAALRFASGGIDVKVTEADNVQRTYTAQGDFLGFSTVSEEFDVKLGKFSISLSGVTTGMVDKFLGKDFEGSPVEITRALLDYQTLAVLGFIKIFDGYIYNVSITENAITCSIEISCATLWSDFDRIAGRKTNNHSNWHYQGGDSSDRAFDKTAIVGNTQFNWGKA